MGGPGALAKAHISLLEGAEDRRWGLGELFLSYSREETALILVLETQKEENLKEAV